MTKQYKVIKVSENWSSEKLRNGLEQTLNRLSKEGWEIINISFLANTYIAMITVAK